MLWLRQQCALIGWSPLSDLAHSSTSKRWLITLSGGLCPTPALQAGIDLALAAGAFGQQVTLVFAGEARALLKPAAGQAESLHRLLGSLPYYEIEQVYALTLPEENLSARDDLTVVSMTPEDWATTAQRADVVVNY